MPDSRVPDSPVLDSHLADSPASVPFTRQAVQRLLNAHAGVVRDAAGLKAAARQLATWRSHKPAAASAQSAAELENLCIVAGLLVQAALARENSIGAHYRSDFPGSPPSGRSPAIWVPATHNEISHLPTSLPVLESETV